MRYRKGQPADAEALVRFQIAMARETEDLELDAKTCGRGVERVFESPDVGHYHVAEADDGSLIASLMITYEWSDWRAGVVWWIQSVWVEPQWRGRGVYRGLYEYVRELARSDEAVRGIRLYVDRRNTTAQEVYARLGMNGEHYLVYEWMK
jgi:GNAT superfamily N-acetyltransferase